MINKNDGFYQNKYFVAKNSDIDDLRTIDKLDNNKILI